MAALDGFLAACADIEADAVENPLRYMRWLRPQAAFLRLDAPRKLYRAGNQALGKSTVGLAEVVYRCLGIHPYYATKKPPILVIICSLNRQQSLAIQAKLHELLPADALAPGCTYNSKTGYGANNPVTAFANGSVIKWVTDDQGPRAVAGATVDLVLVDEPCGPEMLRELEKRVLMRRGDILMTMTPINGPTTHIRERVEAGLLAEVHAPLTVDNCRYADTGELRTLSDGTPCDQAWIDSIYAQTAKQWAPIVNNGEWEEAPVKNFFDCFDRSRHVRADVRLLPRQDAPVRWVMGIDYAAADREYGHVAVLAQVQQLRDSKGRLKESIYVRDEVALRGTYTNEVFVEHVLSMLERNGLHWHQLHAVHGDNPVTSVFVQKSNLETMKELGRQLGVAYNSLQPRIQNAKDNMQSAGSFPTSCQYLYGLLADGRLLIHPSCRLLADGLERWDYTRDHPLKDIVDGLRYAVKPYWNVTTRGPGPMLRVA